MLAYRARHLRSFVIALVALAAAGLGVPSVASANGRFPGATQLVFDGERGVMTTSFGIITSVDRFATPTWSCERSLGYDATQNNDLGIGIFGDGTVVVSGPEGLTISTDRMCTNPRPSGPIGDLWFADVTVDGPHAVRGLAVSRGPRQRDCQSGILFETVDSGRSWAKVSDLPAGFCPLTVDSAPSQPQRVYVSGNVLAPDGQRLEGRMLVSDDRGATWTGLAVPDEARPFIAALDPIDKETLYVRTSNPPDAGRLLVSTDGAKTFRTIATLTGVPLQFFGVTGVAVSPDGQKLAYGSVNEGLFVVDGKGAAPSKRSAMPVMCLTWTADGLYACSAPNLCGPFFVGVSQDDGRTFATTLPTLDIGGDRTTCAGDTPMATTCPADWPDTQRRLASCSDGGAPVTDGGAVDAGAASTPLPKVACDCRGAGAGGRGSREGAGALTSFVLAAVVHRMRRSRISETATRGRSVWRRRGS